MRCYAKSGARADVGAKVRKINGAWWVVVHHQGKKRRKRIGPTLADKRMAEETVQKINASITLGKFDLAEKPALPCDQKLRSWLLTYSPTFKQSTQDENHRIIEQHLVPFFGSKNLADISPEDLLR